MDEELNRALGFDTQRIWANQAQVQVTGPLAQIVFKESAQVQQDDGSVRQISKNVVAVILPTDVILGLSDVIKQVVAAGQVQVEPK
ncbi:MAG: hypothetical protein HOP95_10115 [Sphingomonas sp.]|nr:hypothetical protein [Sphingomonas sp.]